MNWTPINDPLHLPAGEKTVDVIVTDGEEWTRAVYIDGDGFKWLKTHLVSKGDASHYLIPELP